MIHTRICDILKIDHPIALGGMPKSFNSAELVAAVSNTGALGMIGSAHMSAALSGSAAPSE